MDVTGSQRDGLRAARTGLVLGVLLAVLALSGCTPSASDATAPRGRGSGSTAAGGSAPPTSSPSAKHRPGGGRGGPGSAGGSAARPPAPVPAGVPHDLARFYTQRLRWEHCPGVGDLQCTRLRVPLSYAHPDGPTIRIAVLRLPARDQAHRLGSLVVNPGGPGGSGVDYARYAALVIDGPVRDRYDVVGFDPRGVARSSPVDCVSDRQLDRLLAADGSPDDRAEEQRALRLSRQFARGCEQRSGKLLAHISTEDVARDMDVLRGALGDRTLTYLGKSYGTFLGATYAELFPHRAGRLVLDGALDPSLTSTELGLQQAKGFEVALRAFLTDCVRRTDCPLGHDSGHGSGPGLDDAYRVLDTFLAGVDRHPLPSESGRPVTQSLVSSGVLMALYVKQYWPRLRTALRAALAGDGTRLLGMADEYAERGNHGYTSNASEVIVAVNCVDRPDLRSLREAERLQPRYVKASPRFGPLILWGSLPCAVWPVPPQGRPHQIHAPGAPPILVVGTTRDPATPYAWARSLASQLDSGVLLTRDGDGHTGYMQGSPCVDAAVNRFLLKGAPPASGTVCS